MEIAPQHALRTLRYIETVASYGGQLSSYDIDAYALADPPKDEVYSTSVFAFINSLNSHRVSGREPVFAYLDTVGWIYDSPDDGIVLTPLGKAILHAELADEDDAAPAPGQVQDVVLNPDSQLGVVELLRRLRDAGEGMIVDPYFKHDMLKAISESTTITRILIAKKGENDLIGHALHELGRTLDQLPEIRYSTQKEMHDRCIITASGKVSLIGGSMTGVGVNITSIVHPSEPVQRFYREQYGKIWDSAAPVEPRAFRVPIDPASEAASPQKPKYP